MCISDKLQNRVCCAISLVPEDSFYANFVDRDYMLEGAYTGYISFRRTQNTNLLCVLSVSVHRHCNSQA